MPSLCSICHDSLTESSQGPSNEVRVCALSCGHLFHIFCAEQWFKTTAKNARANGGLVPKRDGKCPLCNSSCSLDKALRVFLTRDADFRTSAEQNGTLEALKAENEDFLEAKNVTNQILSRVSSELEDEIVSHDALKFEYAKTLSNLTHLQETRANMQTQQAKIEKLKEERKATLRKVREMAAQLRKLEAKVELLRTGNRKLIQRSK